MTAMNYTRKRALLACDFCRHRKRRCDGERPCSTCRESNADCRYKDLPVERVEPSPGSGEAVSEQLNRIEEMLRRLMSPNDPHDAGVITDEGTEASGAMMTHSLTETSGPYTTTSPPVSNPDSHNFLYDFSQDFYSDYPQQALPYHDSITTSTGSSAPIISLSLAPPAVPPVSTLPTAMPMTMPMTSTPQLAIPSSSLTPSLTSAPSLSPVSPVSQPGTINSLSPDFAFVPPYSTGFGLTAIPAVSLPDSLPLTLDHHPQPQQVQFHRHQKQLNHQIQNHQIQNHNLQPLQAQENQLIIPREKSTAADSLLSMPEIEFLISRSRIDSDDKGVKVSKDTVSYLPLSPTYFYDIEAALPLQKELDLFYSPGPWQSAWPLPITDKARTDKITIYVQAYFTNVYPNTPLVNIGQYAELSKGMFDAEPDRDSLKGNDHSIQKAICLAIWAIGALVTGGPNDTSPEHDALVYFQPAFKIIQHHALFDFGPPSLAVCQALLLAASYFAHIGRPLYNARMVHLAGCQLIKLYQQYKNDRDFCMAFWVCFLWESDRAAEFDVPLSGVIELADDMPMPVQGATDDLEAMIYFNAEIAVRKISNETRDWLYGQAAAAPLHLPIRSVGDAQPTLKRRRGDDELSAITPSSIPSSIPSIPSISHTSTPTIHTTLNASTELNLRLDAWYRVIPQNVQPPLQGNVYDRQRSPVQKSIKSLKNERGRNSRSPSSDIKLLPLRAQILRAQYYAARHLIHRPFVLALAAHQKQTIEARERRKQDTSRKTKADDAARLPPAVLEKCAVCVDSCLMFLINVLPLLDHRSPYLWSFCQTSVACLVVLLVVQACPPMHATNAARHAFAGGKSRKVSIARLRDQVAKKLSRWAAAGSSFEAELRLVQGLPVPAEDSTLYMIPAGLAGPARHDSIKRE